MNDREDLEHVLKSFEHESRTGLRRSLVDVYEASVNRERPLFARRVPLYAAVTAVFVAAALSFVAARLVGVDGRGNDSKPVQELTWSAAEEDLL